MAAIEAAEDAGRAAEIGERTSLHESKAVEDATNLLETEKTEATRGARLDSPTVGSHKGFVTDQKYDLPESVSADEVAKRAVALLGDLLATITEAAVTTLLDTIKSLEVVPLEIGGDIDPSKVLLKDEATKKLVAVGDGHVGGSKNLGDDPLMKPSTSSKRYVTAEATLKRMLTDLFEHGDADVTDRIHEKGNAENIDPAKLATAIEELRQAGAILDVRVSFSELGAAIDELQAAAADASDAAAQARSIQEGRAPESTQPAADISKTQAQTAAEDAKREVVTRDDADLSGKTPDEAASAKRINNMTTTKEKFIRVQQGGDVNELIALEKEKAFQQSTHDQTASVALDFWTKKFDKELTASGDPDEAVRKLQQRVAPTHGDMFFERCKFQDVGGENEIEDFAALKQHFEDTNDNVTQTVRDNRNNWLNTLELDGENQSHLYDSYCGDGTIDNYVQDEAGTTVQPPFCLDKDGNIRPNMKISDLAKELDITIGARTTFSSSWDEATTPEGQFNANKWKDRMKDREKLFSDKEFTKYLAERNHENFTGDGKSEESKKAKGEISEKETDARRNKKRKDDQQKSNDSQQKKDSMFKRVTRTIMSYVVYYMLTALGVAGLGSMLSGFGRQMMDNQNGCWLAYLKADGKDFEWKCKVRPLTCSEGAKAAPTLGTLNTGDTPQSLFDGSVVGNFVNIQEAVAGSISSTSKSIFTTGPLTYTPCEICGAGGTLQGRKGMREAFSGAERKVHDDTKDLLPKTSAEQSEFNKIYYPVWSPIPSALNGVGTPYPNKKLDDKRHNYSYSKTVEDGSEKSTLDQSGEEDSDAVSCHGRDNTMPLFAHLPDASWVNAEGHKAEYNCNMHTVKPTRSPFDGPVTDVDEDGTPKFSNIYPHNGPFPGTDVAANDPCRVGAVAPHSGEKMLDCLTNAITFFVPGDQSPYDTGSDSAYYSKINGPAGPPHTPAVPPGLNEGKYGASTCFQKLVEANNTFNKALCATPDSNKWCSQKCDKKNWPAIADDPRYKMVCVKNDEMQAMNNLLGGVLDPLLGNHSPFDMSNLVYLAYFIIIITSLHLLHSLLAG